MTEGEGEDSRKRAGEGVGFTAAARQASRSSSMKENWGILISMRETRRDTP